MLHSALAMAPMTSVAREGSLDPQCFGLEETATGRSPGAIAMLWPSPSPMQQALPVPMLAPFGNIIILVTIAGTSSYRQTEVLVFSISRISRAAVGDRLKPKAREIAKRCFS